MVAFFNILSFVLIINILHHEAAGEVKSLILNPETHFRKFGNSVYYKCEVPSFFVKTKKEPVCEPLFQQTRSLFENVSEKFIEIEPEKVVKTCTSKLPGIVHCFPSKDLETIYVTEHPDRTYRYFEGKALTHHSLSRYCEAKIFVQSKAHL